MRYRNKPVEIEAMQWHKNGGNDRFLEPMAREIIAWVNANGGEARYEPEYVGAVGHQDAGPQTPPTIWLRVADGSAVAVPGDYIVKSFVFTRHVGEGTPAAHQVREFYPLHAEAFEARWEPVE